jgi:hypothetical protein
MNAKRLFLISVVVFVALMVLAALAGRGTNRLQPSTTRPLIIKKRVSGTPPTPRFTIAREFFCSPPVMTPIEFGHWEGGTWVPATVPPWSPPPWCPTSTPRAPLRHARLRP